MTPRTHRSGPAQATTTLRPAHRSAVLRRSARLLVALLATMPLLLTLGGTPAHAVDVVLAGAELGLGGTGLLKVNLNLLPTPSGSVPAGGRIFANANLLGAQQTPGGTMTFTLYSPTDTTCTTPIFTSTVPVTGTSVNSASYTTTAAGTYRWVESYSGDANYNPQGPTSCTGATVVVDKARSAVNVAAAQNQGPSIHAGATLTNSLGATGTITFRVSGPDDVFCSAPALFTSQVTVNGNGVYDSGDYFPRRSGDYKWQAIYDGDANNRGVSLSPCLNVNGVSNFTLPARAGDFDGDGKADLAISRPSSATWFVIGSATAGQSIGLGISGAIDVPGDYDGDGRTDAAVFQPSNGGWYVHKSSGGDSAQSWGTVGDIPVPADYDGDGKTDLGVFRPSTAAWYVYGTSSAPVAYVLGASNDVPVPADYDGDGKADVAVFRPATGAWYVQRSAGGSTAESWGTGGDIPVPADYDGDGKTDLGVFRPSQGVWYLYGSTMGGTTRFLGRQGDVPAPADYDGDGAADVATFRPSTGGWSLSCSTAGNSTASWGTNGDTVLVLAPAVRLRLPTL